MVVRGLYDELKLPQRTCVGKASRPLSKHGLSTRHFLARSRDIQITEYRSHFYGLLPS